MKVGSLAAILMIACMGLLSAQAQGKAKAPTDVVIYDIDAYDGPNVLAFGQIFSSKESCSANRKFKLIATTGSATEVVDKGKSSDEGGVAVAFDETKLAGITGIGIVVPNTSKCAQASAPFGGGKVVARAKPAKSQVEIVGIDGENKDGAVAGVVTSGKSECVGKRKVELLVDGRKRDAGTTSKAGAFALHITAHEAKDGADIKVSVKKTSKCSGATGKPQPLELPKQRSF
jgi:hypothetical protein